MKAKGAKGGKGIKGKGGQGYKGERGQGFKGEGGLVKPYVNPYFPEF